MSIENIVTGFHSTGIHPFNPHAILSKLPSSPNSTAESENMDSVQPTVDAMSQNGDNDDSEPENSQLELDPTTRYSLEIISQYETRMGIGYDIHFY